MSFFKKIISRWNRYKTLIVVLYIAFYVLFGSILKINCLIEHFFGFYCPGCGYTRAVLSALQLKFVDAWNYHPLFWTFPLIILGFLTDCTLFNKPKLDMAITIALLASFFVCWAVRMIVGFNF